MSGHKHITLACLFLSILSIKTVYSINCYQCSGTDSDNPFDCNEFLDSETDLLPTDCGSIHDAQYCIKHVGRFEGIAIDCYQCNSSSMMECGDGLMNLDGGILKPTSCGHVYNAMYCIKQTGFSLTQALERLWGQETGTSRGGISTKRFCSSLDLGNYCNYVQQPGDKLEYRTCIYTCGVDGCNVAGNFRVPALTIIFGLCLLKYLA